MSYFSIVLEKLAKFFSGLLSWHTRYATTTDTCDKVVEEKIKGLCVRMELVIIRLCI